MDPDPGGIELDSREAPGIPPSSDEPASCSDHQNQEPELDPLLVWVPGGRRLISGLLGLNVVLLGAALVAGEAFNPEGLKHEEPQVFILLLLGACVLWMLWYLLWARKQPGISPHKDHHAGGIVVTLVLLLFAAFSLLLYVFKAGYLLLLSECKAAAAVLAPFFQAPFLVLQTYLLWAHSKDCIHKHKVITRSGLMLILSANVLLWLDAVTEDTIHEEIELEKRARHDVNNVSSTEADDFDLPANWTLCRCSSSSACLIFRKGFEVLYPFAMEFYLMAGCMVYVMWKNVGRRMTPGHHHVSQKLTLHVVYEGGIIYGVVSGALVLLAGVAVFVLYQVWLSQPQLRLTAFLVFYGYHLAVMPVMSLCCLAGLLIQKLERRAHEDDHNPTRSLDVMLLLAAALGQIALSYFSLVAALALGSEGLLEDLDLSYSLLCLLELILQNIFIIQGLHRHPSLYTKKKERRRSSIFWSKDKKAAEAKSEEKTTDISLLENSAAAAEVHDGKKPWMKKATKEICAFLILSNIMLWIIPAFGAHPQFENGLGKQFFGFSAWFVLVNLGQPLSVFYRMHSVGALMELLITA
ncbi:uncharacterized protein V6R79_021017 [Siganus canaliculatus]